MPSLEHASRALVRHGGRAEGHGFDAGIAELGRDADRHVESCARRHVIAEERESHTPRTQRVRCHRISGLLGDDRAPELRGLRIPARPHERPRPQPLPHAPPRATQREVLDTGQIAQRALDVTPPDGEASSREPQRHALAVILRFSKGGERPRCVVEAPTIELRLRDRDHLGARSVVRHGVRLRQGRIHVFSRYDWLSDEATNRGAERSRTGGHPTKNGFPELVAKRRHRTPQKLSPTVASSSGTSKKPTGPSTTSRSTAAEPTATSRASVRHALFRALRDAASRSSASSTITIWALASGIR